MVLEKGP